jgi:rRNA maturation endonuclease Nob1
MSFFQNLGKKVGDAAKGVKEKIDELAAIAKLNKSIADENKKIAQAYTDIGKKVYEFYKQGELIHDSFADECQTIDLAEKAIVSFQEQILNHKNLKKCPNCGNEVAKDVLFCPKCGNKFEVAEAKAEEGNSDDTKVCPSCKAKSPSDSAFCISCGTKLD